MKNTIYNLEQLPITPACLAEITGVTSTTIYKWIAEELIPAPNVPKGKKMVWLAKDLNKLLQLISKRKVRVPAYIST